MATPTSRGQKEKSQKKKTERNIDRKPGNGGVRELFLGSGKAKAHANLVGPISGNQSPEKAQKREDEEMKAPGTGNASKEYAAKESKKCAAASILGTIMGKQLP